MLLFGLWGHGLKSALTGGAPFVPRIGVRGRPRTFPLLERGKVGTPPFRPFTLTPGSSPGQALTLSHRGRRGLVSPALGIPCVRFAKGAWLLLASR